MSRAPDCSRIRLLLEAYADGELPAVLAGGVEAHLATCPDCAARAARLAAAAEALRSWPVLSGSDFEALKVQSHELVQAFAASGKAKVAGRSRAAIPIWSTVPGAARRQIGKFAQATRRPALRILGAASRSALSLSVKGLALAVPGADDLAARVYERPRVAGVSGRSPGSQRKRAGVFLSRLRRSTAAVSAAGTQVLAVALRGAVTLG